MTSFTKIAAAAVALAVLSFAISPARAQQASEDSLAYAQLLGEYCPGKWETPYCLKAVSQSNLTMVANYGGALQESGKTQEAENIKQHCAASTAATEGDYPAYAMKSAFIECANTISDTASRTGMQPDLSLYQLLVGATMCLDQAAGCANIEQTLRQHAQR